GRRQAQAGPSQPCNTAVPYASSLRLPRPDGLQKRAHSRIMTRPEQSHMTFTLQLSSKFIEHNLASKDSAGIGDVHWTGGRKKADSDNIGDSREIPGSLFQNFQSNYVALLCGRVHQFRKCGYTRT